jgi:GNAT superfamily N-acetyltransferase
MKLMSSRDLVRIRPARADEAPDIAAAHVHADWETYAPIFGEKAVRREFAASLVRWRSALEAGDVLLVAEDGGRIVGFAHANDGWLSALYLIASHHRRGLGARLLAQTCERLRARGVNEIGFQAVAANTSAIAFYEAQGARQVGRKIEGEADETWEEVVFRLSTEPLPASRRP